MKVQFTSAILTTFLAVILTLNCFSQVDKCQSPYLHIPSGSSTVEQLPLKHTEVKAFVYGQIAEVRVTQEYENTGETPIEAIYVFPASTRAAVHRMTMEVGGKCVIAKIMEKAAAQETYDEAKAEGKSAALLEQDRPNVFTMNVSNIMPGDKVKLVMSYTENLVPEDGVYEFLYPTAMTPRYTGESTVETGNIDYAVQPFIGEGGAAPFTFNFEARLMTNIPIDFVECKTHDVDITDDGDGVKAVSLSADEISNANQDFVLSFSLQGGEIQSGLALHEGEDENYFMLTIEPPARIESSLRPPQELIFIVDVSGSMNGFPLDMSKKVMDNLLSNLNQDDVFNVQMFAGGSRLLYEESQKATAENIEAAKRSLSESRAGGGTNMLGALNKSLKLPPQENYARTFLILTDGGISVERQVYELIRDLKGDANFFAMGIGCAPNHYLLEGMAKVGGGEADYCSRMADADAKAEEFRLRATSPVLTDVQMDFAGLDVYDVYPEKPFDLFANVPVIVMGKYKGEPRGSARMIGKRGSEIYESKYDIGKKEYTDAGEAVRLCWAREKIREIADFQSLTGLKDEKQNLIDLGIKHNLLTEFTSFVAVSPDVRNESGEMVTINQPQPLPKNTTNMALGGRLASSSAIGNIAVAQNCYAAPPMELMKLNSVVDCDVAIESITIEEEIFDGFDNTEALFMVVEKEAEYPGGHSELIKDITSQIEYPLWAKKERIEGTVYVRFKVDNEGNITHVKIVRGLHDDLDKLVLSAFKNLKKFTPAQQRGANVSSSMVLPVKFVLASGGIELEME